MSYSISPADWDSRFFGFPIGNLELPADYSKDELEVTLSEAHAKYRLIGITLHDSGDDTLPVSSAVCPCVVRQLTFKKTNVHNAAPLDQHVRAYTSTFCSPALERLAVQSGTMTRFKQDPELSARFEQLFLTWINNAVSKELADSIWTWFENGVHQGLVTVRSAKRTNPETGELEKEGRIGMLAVDSKHRQQGVGTHLLEACEFWCSSLDIPVSAIVTQKGNEPMISLCKKQGFQEDHEDTVYHYWSPNWLYDAHRGWVIKV